MLSTRKCENIFYSDEDLYNVNDDRKHELLDITISMEHVSLWKFRL